MWAWKTIDTCQFAEVANKNADLIFTGGAAPVSAVV